MSYAIGFALGAVYLAGAIASFGACLGYYQRKYPDIAEECYPSDVRFALFMAATPIGWAVCAAAMARAGYGLQFGRRP